MRPARPAQRGHGRLPHRASSPGWPPAPRSPASWSTSRAPRRRSVVAAPRRWSRAGLRLAAPAATADVREPARAATRARAPWPSTWRNWSGLESRPDSGDPAAVGRRGRGRGRPRARAAGSTVKMVGTGHTFTGDRAPPSTRMLLPGRADRRLAVDRDAMTVTALAGTPLQELNAQLERLGLSLHNMGDIAEQTLAGAISTGTHGTGGVASGSSAQVVGLSWSPATARCSARRADRAPRRPRGGPGRARRARRPHRRSPSRSSRCSASRRSSSRCRGTRRSAAFDELVGGAPPRRHVLVPPHRPVLTKRNDRLDITIDEAEPLSRLARPGSTTTCSPTRCSACRPPALNRCPRAIPRATRSPSRLLGPRDLQRRRPPGLHRLPRRRLPRDGVRRPARGRPRRAPRGAPGLRGVRAGGRASRSRSGSPPPTTCRCRRRTAATRSTSPSTPTVAPTTREYFALMEPILRDLRRPPALGQAPHPHRRRPGPALYPRFDDFLALRDRLDPDRVFTNPYLRRVLGS